MDTADVLARLYDVRDPATGVAEAAADALAGASVGVLSALLLFILLRAITKRLPTQRELVSAELTRVRHLAPDQRLLAQTKLVDRIAPDPSPGFGEKGSSDPTRSEDRNEPWELLRADLRDALYRRDPAIDLDRVEGEILRLLSSRRR